MKFGLVGEFLEEDPRRPPHGGRGLKYQGVDWGWFPDPSPPTRGAWIEIVPPRQGPNVLHRRPPHGGRGLKWHPLTPSLWPPPSPPTRGAWIEILRLQAGVLVALVAPHTGGVD